MTSVTTSPQSLPPATPRYILRGHASAIQALHFFANNSRLISADADGWLVLWDVPSKRARAVWQAHQGAILEVKGYQTTSHCTTIYSHGRDHRLRVWQIKSLKEEELLSRVLPVDRTSPGSHQNSSAEPWLIHSLHVNALNFCAFTICFVPELPSNDDVGNDDGDGKPDDSMEHDTNSPVKTAYVAVPNAINSGAIDIFHLPSERRVSTISADSTVQTGMVMAVKLIINDQPSTNSLIYMLSGYEDGHVMVHASAYRSGSLQTWNWSRIYISRPHSQPILSLDCVRTEKTSHFYTSSADALIVKHPIPSPSSIGTATGVLETAPLQILNTKHSGQQGLCIRGDQKLFATAGWDARIRIYSCKTMKELAVLKWHSEGCYAVAFAAISPSLGVEQESPDDTNDVVSVSTSKSTPLEVVQQQRIQKAQKTHWLAAGSKDGKISLWDIY